jgi:hypothetical protein|tara:strand:- start:235 stop:663 length:429 start_codon:yes stop_codon:yes gene_type:complete
MLIPIPRKKSIELISMFQYLSSAFPEKMPELVDVNKQAPEGVVVEIKPMRAGRSRPQENYYRKWCGEFARFCGMTPDEMHEEMLCQCYGSTEHSTKFGLRRRPAKRSNDANKHDYSELIEALCRIAAEVGFYVPPAEEGRSE